MYVVGPIETPAATGGAGTATGTVTTTVPVRGYVMGVYIQYLDSPPAATTDMSVETAGTQAPAIQILALANSATDGWWYPHTAVHLNTDGTVIAGQYSAGVPIDDFVKVTMAQANNNDYAKVWLLVDGE